MKGKLVVVYGDIVADHFIYGTPKRISREAPVLILRQDREDILLGGGGNAIHNILSLGGVPKPVSVVGEDAAGAALLQSLSSRGVDCNGIVPVARYRTPTKVRILGGFPHAARQQIVRYDIEDQFESREDEAQRFATFLRDEMSRADGALISDYGYGVVTPGVASRLIESAGKKPVTLDSRYDLLMYPNVTAATPNEDEAAKAVGIDLVDDEKLMEVGDKLLASIDSEALLITRGSRGMALFEKDREPVMIPVSGTDQVADVTGAGDTVIATFTLALAAGASYAEAAKLANYAGGIVVMKMGTATVSNDELRYAIERDEELHE
ncbi:MAG TPA: bifunctional ADP-heptose synthase [Thermoanaerobaculia bacterium]|jgi:rfaE bifunctional protein kinase chain/domain|nr:bifunctional ADP-heptose synthase [Thermoanaerobaculia bacterium]